MDRVDDTYALIMAQSALLGALARTHPNPTELLRAFLQERQSLEEAAQKRHPSEFVETVKRHADNFELLIPG